MKDQIDNKIKELADLIPVSEGDPTPEEVLIQAITFGQSLERGRIIKILTTTPTVYKTGEEWMQYALEALQAKDNE